MRIYVCVKQVPDTSGKVAVKADGTLDRASMQTIINPDDLAATEAALELKDATGCHCSYHGTAAGRGHVKRADCHGRRRCSTDLRP